MPTKKQKTDGIPYTTAAAIISVASVLVVVLLGLGDVMLTDPHKVKLAPLPDPIELEWRWRSDHMLYKPIKDLGAHALPNSRPVFWFRATDGTVCPAEDSNDDRIWEWLQHMRSQGNTIQLEHGCRWGNLHENGYKITFLQ